MLKKFIFACSLFLLPISSHAEEFKDSYKDWGLFSTAEGSNKVCYITSNPSKKSGNVKGRGDVYTLVTYRGAGIPEVSINNGYNHRSGSEVAVSVRGGSTYSFFTSDKTPKVAWSRDDKSAIASMKKGNSFEVKGASEKGTKSADIYSLSGFSLAYDKMIALCAKPAAPKVAAAKAAPTKATAKKAATKAPAKKAAPKKAEVKKAAPKAASKKAAPAKAPAKKVKMKKAAPKATPKKAEPKKAAPKAEAKKTEPVKAPEPKVEPKVEPKAEPKAEAAPTPAPAAEVSGPAPAPVGPAPEPVGPAAPTK